MKIGIQMQKIPIVGYADKFSLAPGDNINFMVSTTSAKPYHAKLIKVISGDPNPEGPGLIEKEIESELNGEYPPRQQATRLGSCIKINPKRIINDLKNFTIGATIWSTTPSKPDQCIINLFNSDSKAGVKLMIGPNGVKAEIGDGSGKSTRVEVGNSIAERRWYHVGISFDSNSKTLEVLQTPVFSSFDLNKTESSKVTDCISVVIPYDQPLIIAGDEGHGAQNFFNGKIERPFILKSSLNQKRLLEIATVEHDPNIVALWDFSKDMFSDEAVDIGPNKLNGQIINLPTRAMKGSAWDGSHFDWTKKPEHYGAIHFHDDDLYDCCWETDFSFTVPKNFHSGVYAAKLATVENYEEMIPFFVTAPIGKPQSRICVLIPTFTYTVYANIARGNTNDEMRSRIQEWDASPWTADEHSEYGLSTYNYHSDGSGISYSSRKRPIITMRSNVISYPGVPGSGCRHFPADSHLWFWLEKKGYDFDIITDDELHQHGSDSIQNYDVVMTCSHPEYHSHQSLDALQDYTNDGGHLLYLGGNGFYWKVAVSEFWPDAVEIRRGEGGIRAWASDPGEYYNAFDGKYGGLWRRNGRAPQVLSGVGFTSQGDHYGTHYYRTLASYDDSVAWIFDGITEKILGNFGLSGGGAAGFELDRADYRLGTPLNAIILASSKNHDESFVLVPEDILTHHDTWPHEPKEDLIRADIVYFDTSNGGAVFSVGSITFCGSLPHNNCENNISTIIDNVLKKFLSN